MSKFFPNCINTQLYIFNNSSMNKPTFFLMVIMLSSLAFAGEATDWNYEDGVLVLDDKTFTKALTEFPNILVKFYAPWCGHCQTLEPKLPGIAKQLNNADPKVVLAKIDADKYGTIGSKEGIEGFPTLRLYMEDEVDHTYEGELEVSNIVRWTKKNTGPPFELISSRTFEEIKAEASPFLVYFGAASGAIFETIEKIAKKFPDFQFYNSEDTELAEKEGGHKLALYKSGEDTVYLDDAIESDSFLDWFKGNKNKLVYDISDQEPFDRMYEDKLPVIFYFLSEDKPKENREEFTKIAKEMRSEFIFVAGQIRGEMGEEIGEVLGVTKGPRITIAKIVNQDDQNEESGDLLKFVSPEGEQTVESIRQFIQDFKDDKLEPFYKSEDIPASNDKPVKVVVGKNFEDIVLDKSKWVFLEVYAPWCHHCQKLAPKWEKLAKQHLSNDKIVFAKMDGTRNDVQGLNVEGFPTLILYSAGDNAERSFDKGSLTRADIRQFLQERLGDDYTDVDVDEAEERKEAEEEETEEMYGDEGGQEGEDDGDDDDDIDEGEEDEDL